MIEAVLRNHRQSPRKVRLVADLVRGKKVDKALVMLDFLSKKASDPIKGALKMAVANAKSNFQLEPEKLYVKEIRVDEAKAMKRFMPRARGSSAMIKKRSSHIYVVLDTKNNNPLVSAAPKKVEEPEVETEENNQ